MKALAFIAALGMAFPAMAKIDSDCGPKSLAVERATGDDQFKKKSMQLARNVKGAQETRNPAPSEADK